MKQNVKLISTPNRIGGKCFPFSALNRTNDKGIAIAVYIVDAPIDSIGETVPS